MHSTFSYLRSPASMSVSIPYVSFTPCDSSFHDVSTSQVEKSYCLFLGKFCNGRWAVMGNDIEAPKAVLSILKQGIFRK